VLYARLGCSKNCVFMCVCVCVRVVYAGPSSGDGKDLPTAAHVIIELLDLINHALD
jgi:hypothetical protein